VLPGGIDAHALVKIAGGELQIKRRQQVLVME